MIASMKARVKDLEAENLGLRDWAVAAEKGEEEAKKRETTSNNVDCQRRLPCQGFKGLNPWAGHLVGFPWEWGGMGRRGPNVGWACTRKHTCLRAQHPSRRLPYGIAGTILVIMPSLWA